jgi:membrane protease YdiL (CAAX protease family)
MMIRLTNPLQRRNRELVVFFACAYGITWVLWLPLILGKSGLGLIPLEPSPLCVAVGTVGPTIAALISQRLFSGNWRAFRIWSSLWQVATGMVVGSIALLLACFVSAAAGTQSGYGLWNWAALLLIPRTFPQNLAGGPLLEEPGWRGFALPRLQKRFHPLIASVVLGFLWASWHLPLILTPRM